MINYINLHETGQYISLKYFCLFVYFVFFLICKNDFIIFFFICKNDFTIYVVMRIIFFFLSN